ncbi:MAG: nucleotidyltransferase domain-containing protein [Candidatus Woesearchaeota archaeon]
MDNTLIIKDRINILIPFIEKPTKTFSLNEIKKELKITSYHYVYETLEELSKNILIKEKKGNTSLYKLNYEINDFNFLAIAEFTKKEKTKIPYHILNPIIKKIKSTFYIMLITGSYAKQKQTKNSDLDVCIIIPEIEKKQYEIALKEGQYVIPEIHGFVFTENEFYEMLTNKDFNYGKEVARNHVIVKGAEQYYKILFEAIKNGFQG